MNAMPRNLTVSSPRFARYQYHQDANHRCCVEANSGHPGAAMALASLVYTLSNRIVRDPVSALAR